MGPWAHGAHGAHRAYGAHVAHRANGAHGAHRPYIRNSPKINLIFEQIDNFHITYARNFDPNPMEILPDIILYYFIMIMGWGGELILLFPLFLLIRSQ